MVLTERWREHGRLVIVDETGDRLAPLLEPGRDADGKLAIDEHPAFSPDGRWIVFASNRERAAEDRGVWVARALPDARPTRLTAGAARAIDPIWTPEGIVFAELRDSYELFRQPMNGGAPAGPLEQLTRTAEHEAAPSAARGRLVFQVVDPAARRSWIAERDPDGAIRALTDGPSDGAPALAPDGRTLAYVTQRLRDADPDLDVVVLDPDGFEKAELGIGLAGSAEGAPAWSYDGRWLFVTSVLRGAAPDDPPLLSSVIHRDQWAPATPPRMLRDRAGAAPRLGVALAPVRLDETALRRNLDHATAVGYALQEQVEAAAAAEERRKR